MITTHNLGFPRVGQKRELKFALEQYWRGEISEAHLQAQAKMLRQQHWQWQQNLSFVPVGDFSLYDHLLDMSFTLGNIPHRALDKPISSLEAYFVCARGSSGCDSCVQTDAGEMTKWFDTNYHYIVPELARSTLFKLNPERILAQVKEAQQQGLAIKPVIIGPLTYLWLAKSVDGVEPLSLLPTLIQEYRQLLDALADAGVAWVQVDEPILVLDLPEAWRRAFEKTYFILSSKRIDILLATYFGPLKDNLRLLCELPVAGIHVDAIAARGEIKTLLDWLPAHKILSLGVISGRNIWKSDLDALLQWLAPIYQKLQSRLWLAPSCSLLHVPVSLVHETQLDAEIKSWLAFAIEKLDELELLAKALTEGRDCVASALAKNALAIATRNTSARVHNPQVQKALIDNLQNLGDRQSSFSSREPLQAQHLSLPLFPTTTIGSFPQTAHIRQIRAQFKKSEIDAETYTVAMKEEIAQTIAQQEALGLDVLVHGEAERNDMVEYFGEHLEGFAFTQNGWVQSYGSRCVKPPVLFGDVARPSAITVEWAKYAQSLTTKPVKGMLTGPVTILNWSFVRDDLTREQVCKQLALALRDEVLELEQAGIKIIQIDEAALREGLPLRKDQWQHYLTWAIESFRICANGVADTTQIHTHMCYSDFNDIIENIAHMDADVITIETSRSNKVLLNALEKFAYPNQIGPGVYDIHSPNIPSVEQMQTLMLQAAKRITATRLWVNPDCGLKTRSWQEVTPALKNMVSAARALRKQFAERKTLSLQSA